MTRLIPTRDRAQATRYIPRSKAWSVIDRLREMGADGWEGLLEEEDGWIVHIYSPCRGEFWSGPWYVQEVAE